MEYTLQTLRNNTVFNDRADALDFLNNFQHHMNGQPVCVRYLDDQENIQCLFAVGLQDSDGTQSGEEYYHIIEGNTVSQVNADWDAESGPAEILHKPTIPEVHDSEITIQQNGAPVGSFTLNQDQPTTIDLDLIHQVQADWEESDTQSDAYILHKPAIPQVHDYTITIRQNGSDAGSFTLNQDQDGIIDLADTTQVQADWDQSDDTQVDYIKNKPTIPAAQIQSDWDQSDNTAVDYIKNKPDFQYGDVDYFYAESLEDNTTVVVTNNKSGSFEFEYSLDKVKWESVTLANGQSHNISVISAGSKVFMRSDAGTLCDSGIGNNVSISADKNFKVGGMFVTLIVSNGIEPTTIPQYCFRSVFNGSNKLVDASELILTKLASTYSYYTTFQGTSITQTPVLRAEYPESDAYYGMFYGLNTIKVIISCAKTWTTQNQFIQNTTFTSGDFYNLGKATNIPRNNFGCPAAFTMHTPIDKEEVDSGYKALQTPVTDPTVGNDFAESAIDSISQDAQGVITATKKKVYKHWFGTQAEFDVIGTYDQDTIYYVEVE